MVFLNAFLAQGWPSLVSECVQLGESPCSRTFRASPKTEPSGLVQLRFLQERARPRLERSRRGRKWILDPGKTCGSLMFQPRKLFMRTGEKTILPKAKGSQRGRDSSASCGERNTKALREKARTQTGDVGRKMKSLNDRKMMGQYKNRRAHSVQFETHRLYTQSVLFILAALKSASSSLSSSTSSTPSVSGPLLTSERRSRSSS